MLRYRSSAPPLSMTGGDMECGAGLHAEMIKVKRNSRDAILRVFFMLCLWFGTFRTISRFAQL